MSDGRSYEYREAENMCFAGEVKTPFATGRNMDQMKAMLANANPDTVEGVAHAWGRVRDMLVTGDESVKAVFDKTVDHILQHWEGAAAEGFATKARKISTKIDRTATYADRTSIAMQNAANVLRPVKAEVDSMEKPSRLSSMGDAITEGFDRSEDWQKDIQHNRGAQNALDNNEGSLSAGKEAQLRMAARMETLALTYTSQAASIGRWGWRVDDPEDYPPAPIGEPPVPIVVPTVQSRSVSRPEPTTQARVTRSTGTTAKPTANVTSPRDTGITGGVAQPTTHTQPQVGTAIDGISPSPGTTTGAGGGTTGTGGGVGAGGTTGGGAGGVTGGGFTGGGMAGAVSGVRGGAGGRAGSAAGTGRAAAAGRGGAPGVIGTGQGATAAGRGGTPGKGAGVVGPGGMPGAGGMGAAGGRGGAAAGRGGGLARRGGGVVGAAQGTGAGSRGTPGGSGLHRSRGASGAGGGSSAGRGTNGMIGRGQTERAQEEERPEGERPDYLVEDEETWTPERNNAPRVIE